jgi:hypothetical protein
MASDKMSDGYVVRDANGPKTQPVACEAGLMVASPEGTPYARRKGSRQRGRSQRYGWKIAPPRAPLPIVAMC